MGIKNKKFTQTHLLRLPCFCAEQLVHPLCFLVLLQHLLHSVEPEQLLLMFHANVLWLHLIQKEAMDLKDNWQKSGFQNPPITILIIDIPLPQTEEQIGILDWH